MEQDNYLILRILINVIMVSTCIIWGNHKIDKEKQAKKSSKAIKGPDQ